ncbi:formyltransferase family protein [Marivivens donghaensis]|uniref:formyltransferase family protein n=1 Tax=Marivivens donghaensis TaxID=1699413 RepID=UPI00201E84D9|nr:formyltransferase family protein [Marivivens donghaensis]MCL7410158.1 ankyrin repeat domain-containing protein [Marivivens donghaensis]MDN3703378.1 formyltransferase family protein [Marivivens donghaensis]
MTNVNTRKICLAGKNQIAVDALIYMINLGWKDRLMVCPNRNDTGVSTWQPSLIRYAREFGVDVVTLEQAQEVPQLVFISLEFDRIIRPADFQSDRLFNIHFSALPAYKGMYTSALPILHGKQRTGVTLHEIDSGIDTGPIIAQTIFKIPVTWTARDLYFAYMGHGFALFREKLDRLVASEAPRSTAQAANGSSYFAKSEIDYAGLKINLFDTADGIIQQLRAFSFREYQIPIIEDMQIGGWDILNHSSREKPGTVLDRDAESLTIATIDYSLRLSRNRTWEWFEVTGELNDKALDPSHINVRDKNGWTPLIRAAWAGDTRLCRKLLEFGADPNRPNHNGTTPLMYAYSGKNPDEVAEVLRAHGADMEQRDNFGKSLKNYHPYAARNCIG